MSEIFKVSIKGYEKKEVNDFISGSMQKYEKEISHLNISLCKIKEENENIRMQIEKNIERHKNNSNDNLDGKFKMKVSVLEKKIEGKDIQLEKLKEERMALKTRIENEMSKKNENANDVLKLMDRKKEDLIENIKSEQSKQPLENNNGEIIQKIRAVEAKINQVKGQTFGSEKIDKLKQKMEERQREIQNLKYLMETSKSENVAEDFNNEKYMIADIILEAQLNTDKIVRKAKDESELILKEMNKKVLAEEVNLKAIEKSMINIKNLIGKSLNDTSVNKEIEYKKIGNKLVKFE